MKRIILAAFLAVFFLNKAAACTLTTATGGSREAVLIVDVSEREAAASVRLGSRLLNELASRTGDTIYVSIPFAEDIDCYLLYLPLSFLKTDKGIKIELKTPLGTLCVPDGLFKGRRGEYAAVGLRIYDRSVLQKNVLDIIGENTVTEIFAEVDGKPAECASSFITAYLP
ncbi:MAG: hypothetical protein Q8878_03850 [Bacillota bacterium]|nr:hypothetical protein [Bacillota bacterium]